MADLSDGERRNEARAIALHASVCNWGDPSLGYLSAQECWDDPIQAGHVQYFRDEAARLVALLSVVDDAAEAALQRVREAGAELFIADDAHDEPTLWKRNGDRPLALMRGSGWPDVWPLVVAALGVGVPTEPDSYEISVDPETGQLSTRPAGRVYCENGLHSVPAGAQCPSCPPPGPLLPVPENPTGASQPCARHAKWNPDCRDCCPLYDVGPPEMLRGFAPDTPWAE